MKLNGQLLVFLIKTRLKSFVYSPYSPIVIKKIYYHMAVAYMIGSGTD